MCLPKKESIRSSTIGLYSLLKRLRSQSCLSDQDYVLALAYLRKIEQCVYVYSDGSTFEPEEEKIGCREIKT